MGLLKSGLAGAAFAMIAGSAVVAQTYSVGSNPQGSLAYAAGSVVSKVGIDHANLQMRVVPQGGPNVVVPLVNAGELEFSTPMARSAPRPLRGAAALSAPMKTSVSRRFCSCCAAALWCAPTATSNRLKIWPANGFRAVS